MTGPSSETAVHTSDTKTDSSSTGAAHDVTDSEHTGLLSSTSTLSSRPRSYGAIATPDQPSRATSAASPRLPGPHTVDAASASSINTTHSSNSTARTTSVSGGSKRQLITATVTALDNSSADIIHSPKPRYDIAAVAADAESDADIDAGLLSSSSSSSSSADLDSDADMPPQTAFLTSSQRRLAIAYGGLLLVAFTTSLEAQVTAPLAAFAVSSFSNHSLLSTVVVVQGVVNGELLGPSRPFGHDVIPSFALGGTIGQHLLTCSSLPSRH